MRRRVCLPDNVIDLCSRSEQLGRLPGIKATHTSALIERLLRKAPEQRWSAKEALDNTPFKDMDHSLRHGDGANVRLGT